jgi:hypothetical protein
MDTLKLDHLREAGAKDAGDQEAPADKKIKLLTTALRTLAAKLDADSGVSDINYVAVIDAIELA